MSSLARNFIEFTIEQGVLRFGEFTTKAGRLSPYFFNAGGFDHGLALARLGDYYAEAIERSGIGFDGLFGPAYKGIPLVASIAVAFASRGRNVPFSFDRKEAKTHGEGGSVIGAPLHGRILIVDDVISAGTSARASVELIRSSGAVPAGMVVALDRMERGQGSASALDEVRKQFNFPVIAIATLDDLVDSLAQDASMAQALLKVRQYRESYGASVETHP